VLACQSGDVEATRILRSRFHCGQCTGTPRREGRAAAPKASRCATAGPAGRKREWDNSMMDTLATLVLASTSRYRRDLLSRLRFSFEAVAPEVDEAALPGEAPPALARRLALAKAQAVSRQRPDSVVIGSDQVADLHGQAIGKPGTHANAVAQLQRMSGQLVVFHTAVAVVCQHTGFRDEFLVPVRVRFRELDAVSIERYLRLEEPYDCAGSARSEGLGVALLDAIESDDPTALVGLPLIRTCAALRRAGIDPLAAPSGAR
jgi:septum formation protein